MQSILMLGSSIHNSYSSANASIACKDTLYASQDFKSKDSHVDFLAPIAFPDLMSLATFKCCR